MRLVVAASLSGAVLEWYDWFLYGSAAALVFGQLFFPNFSPLAGTLASFATFAAGFVARPLGGIVFGHFGDRLGRKGALIVTMLVMGLGTAAVGLLPTYNSIGIWAPILLVTLRIVQGIAIGGEWGGAALLAVEYAPEGKRGFYGSFPQLGVPAGLLIATGIFALFASLPEEQFLAWGWRIPFLFSALLVAVGLFVRTRIEETPVFTQMVESDPEEEEGTLPIVEVVRTAPKDILIALGSRPANDVSYYISNVFVLAYATDQLGLSANTILTGVFLAAAVSLVSIPAFGALSDRLGRRPVFMGGAAFFILFAFPLFWSIESRQIAFIWPAIILWLAVGHGATYAPMAAFITERFGTRTRYSGASLGYQLSSALIGGPSPFVATALLAWAGHYWPVAVYVMVLGLITFVTVYLASETAHRPLITDEPAQPGEPAQRGAT